MSQSVIVPVEARQRREHIQKLLGVLVAENHALAPPKIWDWPDLGGLVDPADRQLQVAISRYIDGEIGRTELIAAAEQLRSCWKRAVELFHAK